MNMKLQMTSWVRRKFDLCFLKYMEIHDKEGECTSLRHLASCLTESLPARASSYSLCQCRYEGRCQCPRQVCDKIFKLYSLWAERGGILITLEEWLNKQYTCSIRMYKHT